MLKMYVDSEAENITYILSLYLLTSMERLRSEKKKQTAAETGFLNRLQSPRNRILVLANAKSRSTLNIVFISVLYLCCIPCINLAGYSKENLY